MINLAIIEDDPTLRSRFEEYLGQQSHIHLLGSFSTLEEFLSTLMGKDSKIVLVDSTLPGISGIEGVPLIRKQCPNASVIILSAEEKIEDIIEAFSVGALAFISQKSHLKSLLEAINIVESGGSYLSPSVCRKVIEFFQKPSLPKNRILTKRQNEIVDLLTQGKTYQAIADELEISVETVRDHIKKIYKKLGIHSRAALLKWKLLG